MNLFEAIDDELNRRANVMFTHSDGTTYKLYNYRRSWWYNAIKWCVWCVKSPIYPCKCGCGKVYALIGRFQEPQEIIGGIYTKKDFNKVFKWIFNRCSLSGRLIKD